ncbi:hypothetical protein SAMN05216269_11411 [Flavobacterium xinjiangense]|uniref:Uncharacterized protein n=1 Tax=Flavobacterium xinjiangense TaxID=178356 RepID=A0A1M7P5I7_9FLAO|nr:hypothetical protein SAMN05216269_11411 [Flavobacterium xinjiangense]
MYQDNKKWHGTHLNASEVLVYRATISEPTAWDVSILLIISLLKITSFLIRDSKRMLQIFLYEETQIYIK